MRFKYLSIVLLTLVACQSEYRVKENTVTVKVKEGAAQVVRVQVLGEELMRVSATPEKRFHDRQSLVVVPQEGKTAFEVVEKEGKILIATASLTAEVNPQGGEVRFLDKEGKVLLEDGQMAFSPIEVEGKKAWSTQVSYASPEGEAFYGLGQHQAGELNHKGRNEELFQYNTKVSVPVIVSNRGYGLLFDAYSLSRWGNPKAYQQLGEAFKLYDKDGVEGALTGTYQPAGGPALVQREDSLYYENEWAIKNLPAVKLSGAKVVYEGYLEAPETAEYSFIQYYAGFQRTVIGGEEVMSERWRPAWNPNSYKFTARLEKGVKTPVRLLTVLRVPSGPGEKWPVSK